MTDMVSVVMSAFNEEESIEEAIKSVLAQSYQNIELIVIDDHSEDSTLLRVRELAQEDNRIVIIENEKNLGLTESLIIGISRARGTYIARIDADDLFHSEKLALQIALLEASPSSEWCACSALEIDSNGFVVGRQSYDFSAGNERDIYNYMATAANPLYHGSVMFRKSLYDSVGGYRREFNGAEDYDLWLRFMEKSPLVTVNEALYYRKDRVTGVSASRAIHQYIISSSARKCHQQRIHNLDENSIIREMNDLLLCDDPELITIFIGRDDTWYLASKLFAVENPMAIAFLKRCLWSKHVLKAVIKLAITLLPISSRRVIRLMNFMKKGSPYRI